MWCRDFKYEPDSPNWSIFSMVSYIFHYAIYLFCADDEQMAILHEIRQNSSSDKMALMNAYTRAISAAQYKESHDRKDEQDIRALEAHFRDADSGPQNIALKKQINDEYRRWKAAGMADYEMEDRRTIRDKKHDVSLDERLAEPIVHKVFAGDDIFLLVHEKIAGYYTICAEYPHMSSDMKTKHVLCQELFLFDQFVQPLLGDVRRDKEWIAKEQEKINRKKAKDEARKNSKLYNIINSEEHKIMTRLIKQGINPTRADIEREMNRVRPAWSASPENPNRNNNVRNIADISSAPRVNNTRNTTNNINANNNLNNTTVLENVTTNERKVTFLDSQPVPKKKKKKRNVEIDHVKNAMGFGAVDNELEDENLF